MWWSSFLVFRSITRAYYRNSVGVLLIYDTTNYVSFTHVTNWLTDARAQIEPYQSVFLLVGTKIDRESERQVTSLHADLLCLTISVFPSGYYRRRQSIRGFPQHIVHWNIVEIVTLRSRSVYIDRTRDLRSIGWRSHTRSERVSVFLWERSFGERRLACISDGMEWRMAQTRPVLPIRINPSMSSKAINLNVLDAVAVDNLFLCLYMSLLCSLTVDLSVCLSGCFLLPCSFFSGYNFLWREKPHSIRSSDGWINQARCLYFRLFC